MGIKELDSDILKAIKYLKLNNLKISYRNIAKQIGKINSIRSVQLGINRLIEEGKLYKDKDGIIDIRDQTNFTNIKTIKLPLVGNIACGGPILAEEHIEDYIPIAENMLNKVNNYFLLRTSGDSMNKKGINSGDVILIKQQSIAKNGDIVVALIDDSATLKEFKMENGIVKLIPHSTNSKYKTIIVSENLIIQGIYVMNLGKI